MNQSKFVRVSSWLFTPATRPDRFEKAAASGADVSIIGLEDSVAPTDKAEARRTALADLAKPTPDRMTAWSPQSFDMWINPYYTSREEGVQWLAS